LIYSTRADRFLYLPSAGAAAGVALAAAAAVAALERRRMTGTTRPARWPVITVCGLLIAAIVALAIRTSARNRDWQSNLTLVTHDAQSCPNSFRIHQHLAGALFEADRRGNIDRVLTEAETAQAILDRTTPPSQVPQGAVLEHLGLYYRAKAALLPEAERAPWNQKAVDALERAAAARQAEDLARRQHEMDRGSRAEEIRAAGDTSLYTMLSDAYMALGEPGKAVDALLHARPLAPADANIYSALATAYGASGDTRNAILSLLQAFLCDNTRNVWAELYTLYQQTDPGNCAFVLTAGQYQFNRACPLAHRDICIVLERQAAAFASAGDVEAVRHLRDTAQT